MPKERTVIILKPDSIERKIEYKILDWFLSKGTDFPVLYKTLIDKDTAREHYDDVFKIYGNKLGEWSVDYLTSGPSIIILAEYYDAAEKLKTLAGRNSDPTQCEPDTLRREFGIDTIEIADSENRAVRNLIHVPDSKEAAEREILFWTEKYPVTNKNQIFNM